MMGGRQLENNGPLVFFWQSNLSTHCTIFQSLSSLASIYLSLFPKNKNRTFREQFTRPHDFFCWALSIELLKDWKLNCFNLALSQLCSSTNCGKRKVLFLLVVVYPTLLI
jgi:hypothetical protein